MGEPDAAKHTADCSLVPPVEGAFELSAAINPAAISMAQTKARLIIVSSVEGGGQMPSVCIWVFEENVIFPLDFPDYFLIGV
jgi:hypothetical protein